MIARNKWDDSAFIYKKVNGKEDRQFLNSTGSCEDERIRINGWKLEIESSKKKPGNKKEFSLRVERLFELFVKGWMKLILGG